MRNLTRSIFASAALLLIGLICATDSYGQVRTTGEIRGIITDSTGGVLPKVSLKAKDLATGIETSTTSGPDGNYTFLNLTPGVYEVTASLTGFSTAAFPKIPVETARTVDLNITLAVGSTTTTVEVSAEAPALQTTTNTVASTITYAQVQELPLAGRDTLQLAALVAGAQSPGQGTRNSTFNGLPNASLNISVDGVNNNSQRFKTGGTSFFGFTPARLDAIEEMTVTTAGSGADSAAGGAMTIRFMTKRGTDQYHGRVFYQGANDALNANSFFNNATGQRRAKVRQNDMGGQISGPLPIPGPTWKKIFFFVNFEAAPRPNSANRTASILTTSAQQGNYSYLDATGATRTVNLLQIAASKGLPSTIDPTVATLLNTIRGTVSQGSGVIPNVNSPNFETLQWVQPTDALTIYPTARLDYQINQNMAWHGTWNLRGQTNDGTPQYPGLPVLRDGYKITTYIASNTFDWTLKPNLVSSFNIGVQSNHEHFYPETDINQWAGQGNRRINFANGVTPPIPDQVPWIRNNPVYTLAENMTWIKGRHTFTFGGSFLRTTFYETTWNNAGVLSYNLGSPAGDPLQSLITAADIPGIRTQDLSAAWAHYASLTGRLSGVSGSRNLDEKTFTYADMAPITYRFAFNTGGFYFQDSFRMKPTLTLNYGLRLEISGTVKNTNGVTFPPDYANLLGPSAGLFQPGVLDGVRSPVLEQRGITYSPSRFNPAPNFGFTWNPKFENGLLGKLVGNGKTVVRSSYAINYFDEGFNTISNRLTANTGTSQSVNVTSGIEFTPGSLLLSSPLPRPTVNPATFRSIIPQDEIAFRSGMASTKPGLQTPYTQNWVFSIQREIPGRAVLEVRYVGNKSTHLWHGYRLDETNIFENGFLNEFNGARQNLAINRAAGVTSFQNRGLPGQVALPIFEAAFGARGGQAALPAASGWTNGTFINQLDLANVGTMANTFNGAQYFCRMVGNNFGPCATQGYNAAGPYPINFFRPNPYATALTVVDDNSYSTYHGLQVEARRRFSNGLFFQFGYTWSKTLGDLYNLDSQDATDQYRTLRNRDLDKGPTPYDLRHTFVGVWSYDLPFGKGKPFLKNTGWLDRAVGGWSISMVHRWHSGAVFFLSGSRNTFNNISDSGVVLNGITRSELQDAIRSFSPGPNRNARFADPRLIGPDGRANSQFLRVPSTPGVFGQFVPLYGPHLVINDASVDKVIPITERMRFSFQVQAFNVLNHPVLNIGTTNIDSTSFGQTSGALVGARNLQIRARFDW